eukprot:8987784-Alexandrium_andersonii.AAC.1
MLHRAQLVVIWGCEPLPRRNGRRTTQPENARDPGPCAPSRWLGPQDAQRPQRPGQGHSHAKDRGPPAIRGT